MLALLLIFIRSKIGMVVTVPTYVSVKQVLADLDLDPVYGTVGPAIAAVLTVNGILMLYVVSALRQEAREKEVLKPKQS